MEKKQYISPMVETELWNTAEMMKASGTSSDLPPQPGNAPDLKEPGTELF